ncbi:MAG: VCBS repeat-containing protein [Planctomycetaceae bacterium]|nr:VCBS repeat-containing protein [Planctomycetaceae bacterium]
MSMTPRGALRVVVVFAVAVTAAAYASRADETPTDLSQFYGFKPLEIFKLEQRSAGMVAGDLNHDGLTDLLIADNSHNRLDLLQQRKTKPEVEEKIPEKGVNYLGSTWRFEHRKLPVDKQVAATALGDFNKDGLTDIAYFGVPDRLIVRFQPKTGEWTESVTFRLPDVNPASWIIAAGDLNNDERDDIAVLGKGDTYLLYQGADGKLAPPKTLMNTSSKLSLAQIADFDGDGRKDLCYIADDDSARSLCARLQGPNGQLGPELGFDLQKPRAITVSNVDGKPGQEILTIDASTGRLKASKISRPVAKKGELAARLIQYGFGQSSGKDRDLAVGDLDGDGLNDVVVTDPEAAQMIVFRQRKDQGLDLGTPFPGLVGAEQVRVADLDGDKAAEVIVLSSKERSIGVSNLKEGRLTFSQPLPVEGEPVAIELADFDSDGKKDVIYLSRQKEGRSSKYGMHVLNKTDDGWKLKDFGGKPSVPLDLPATPTRLVLLDANADGKPEFLIFFGGEKNPALITLDETGKPKITATDAGIRLGDVNEGGVFIGVVDKPAVLVARDNFVRNLQLDEKQQWKVADQYNAVESNAKIVGAAALNLDGEDGNEIVLVDSGIRKLRILRKEGSLYRNWKEVEIGAFPYKGTQVADLNGDGQDDLLLFGTGRFAVLYAGQTNPVLEEVGTFESKLENTFFADVTAGDVNGDGKTDIVLIDTRSHFVEIVNYHPVKGLRHALHFKVFESKSFGNDDDSGTEPRESVIVDVTGDGRADLVLLAHDRLLVYPQDTGEGTTAGK